MKALNQQLIEAVKTKVITDNLDEQVLILELKLAVQKLVMKYEREFFNQKVKLYNQSKALNVEGEFDTNKTEEMLLLCTEMMTHHDVMQITLREQEAEWDQVSIKVREEKIALIRSLSTKNESG